MKITGTITNKTCHVMTVNTPKVAYAKVVAPKATWKLKGISVSTVLKSDEICRVQINTRKLIVLEVRCS